MNINNLSSILLAALFILSTAFTSVSFSQEEVVMDSIITGGKYRITLYTDKEIIGKVTKQDSVYVYMSTDEGTVRIRHEDIFSVSKSTVPRLMAAMFTLGGGILLRGGGNYYNSYNDENKPGYSFQVTGLYPFSENKAIRIDISYSRFNRTTYDYYYYYTSPPENSKQNIDFYNAYAQIIFGDFNTRTNFSVYGIAGVGLMHINEGDYKYTYYNYYDSTYTTQARNGYNYTNFSMTIGGGLRFKINNRLGIFTEIQYNMTAYEGFFWFFGGGNFPIRGGLTYTFF